MQIFDGRKHNAEKLIKFGFIADGDGYKYVKLLDCGLLLTVTVGDEKASSEIIDPETDEPYTLHLVTEASGGFVGQVRAEYEQILTEIAEKCFESNVFKENLTEKLVKYVSEKYGDEPEFLWEKSPDCAVWRRKDNRKWYGAILTAAGERFGRTGRVELIDLRILPADLDGLVDESKYFRGYHMNKKSWLTVILDGSVGFEELCGRIDGSYLLALKK